MIINVWDLNNKNGFLLMMIVVMLGVVMLNFVNILGVVVGMVVWYFNGLISVLIGMVMVVGVLMVMFE